MSNQTAEYYLKNAENKRNRRERIQKAESLLGCAKLLWVIAFASAFIPVAGYFIAGAIAIAGITVSIICLCIMGSDKVYGASSGYSSIAAFAMLPLFVFATNWTLVAVGIKKPSVEVVEIVEEVEVASKDETVDSETEEERIARKAKEIAEKHGLSEEPKEDDRNERRASEVSDKLEKVETLTIREKITLARKMLEMSTYKGKVFDEVSLPNGKTYKEMRITKISGYSVEIKHKAGVGKIDIDSLPESDLEEVGLLEYKDFINDNLRADIARHQAQVARNNAVARQKAVQEQKKREAELKYQGSTSRTNTQVRSYGSVSASSNGGKVAARKGSSFKKWDNNFGARLRGNGVNSSVRVDATRND